MRYVNREGGKFEVREVWGINPLRSCQTAESSSRQEPGQALAVEWTVIRYIDKQLLMRC